MLTMPGEVVLARLAGVSLTTYRVQLEVDRWGEKKLTTITLDDLTSCDIESRSKPTLLVLGVLGAIIGLLLQSIWFALPGGVAICVWFFSRRKIMVLSSASEKIEVPRPYGQWMELQQFIHQIQTAKADRLAPRPRGQEARSPPLGGQTTVMPLKHPERPSAEKPTPLPKPEEQGAVLPARHIWTGAASSFTFDSKTVSSSVPAVAVPKSPGIASETSSQRLATPATQIDRGSEGTKSTSAESEKPESVENTSEIGPSVAPLPAPPIAPDQKAPSSRDIASAVPKQPKARSTTTLIARITIAAVIVVAAALVVMNWFSIRSRNSFQSVPSETSRNRELGAREVLNLAAPVIVLVEVFDDAGLKKGSGGGFMAENGAIMTNYHVVRGSTAAKVHFQNGDTAEVLGVLGYDVGLDVAVLRITGASTNSAPLGDPGQLQIGSRLFAVCSHGSQNAVSGGQVSEIRSDGLIQTGTPISPTSSGCPLFDTSGQIIGIAVTGAPGFQNRNFVVPINWAKRYTRSTEVASLADLVRQNTVIQELIHSTISVVAGQRQSWSFEVDGARMANPELPQTILTFEEFWTKHFQLEILTKRKFSTQQVYRYLVGKHLLPFFGRQRMCDISRLDVQSFVSQKQRQRYAPKTLMHLRNLLSKIFGVAISWGWLNGNPATGVELPPREKRREARVLALGEIARLSQAFGEPVKTIFLLGLLTGLRIGEIQGIRIGDVDVTGRLLYVRRDVYRGHVQDVPKTKQSERGVPLAAILVVAIQQWLGMRPSGSEWLFPSNAGTPHHDRNLLRREVWPICDELDIPRFGWHSPRHTATTYGGNNGIPMPVLQSILGHTSAETTMIYTHPLVEAQREAVEKLARILFSNVPTLEPYQSGAKAVIQ